MEAREVEQTTGAARVIDLTLDDTDSESRGPASSSASPTSGSDIASIARSTSNGEIRYVISPTFERSEQRRLMSSANKDVNQTMARLQDRANSVKLNDLGFSGGYGLSRKRSSDEMEDEGMPEDHPFRSMKASRKSAVCVQSVPSPTTSSICEITDVRTAFGSVPSRQGIPWGLESTRKPRAVHKASLPPRMQDDAFSATYLESFHHPRFKIRKCLATYRRPFLNRNILRCLIATHGDPAAKDRVKSQATPKEVILDHLLPKRLHEESQVNTARLGRILQVDLTSIQGEKAPPVECGDYVRVLLLLSDGSKRPHRVAWKVNRRVNVTKTGLVSFDPPITEGCLVPADWATCVGELRILLDHEGDDESKPCSPQFALCRGGIYEDLHEGPGVMIGQNIVARTLPGSFEWTYSSRLRQLPRKLSQVTKRQPSLHFLWNDDLSAPPSPSKIPQITGWWCPFCTIGDCLEYRIWSKHMAGSHGDQLGVHNVLRDESRAGHLVIRLERPDGAISEDKTLIQRVYDLVRAYNPPTVQAIDADEYKSQESSQRSSSDSNPSRNSTSDQWGSDITSLEGSRDGDALSNKAFHGLDPDLAMVKQELPEGQTWRVRDPKRYVSHSSWTVPGTTMDLMCELRKYFQGDKNESYVGRETANLVWTQHHLTDRMRLMSCVWNQWREEKGPMGKQNTDGYMLAFVRRYASFFRIARLRSEFERLVMDFLWERRLVSLDLALGIVALYHELVQDE